MPTRRKIASIKAPAEPASQSAISSATAAPKAPGKTQLLIDLLISESGATIAQITDATGWLPHSARAALTGLRKKGHSIARTSADGTTTYRILEPAQ